MRIQKLNPSAIDLPLVIFGTSGLGNLFVVLPEEVKMEIVKQCLIHSPGRIIFDSAGKYGAGLALESLGRCLKALNVQPGKVVVSNKLGWLRTELKTPEPTFETGVWRDLKHDAVQKISYEGIIDCFNQGNELLQGFVPQMVSVHDPDEYLATANNSEQEARLYQDILEAYRALADLKLRGKVSSVGVGAKNWRIIARIAQDVKLDWVMIANSMTLMNHPQDLLNFMSELEKQDIQIINSAVFHSGFLIGGSYYDYKLVEKGLLGSERLFRWRDEFFGLCKDFNIHPAEVCVQFALSAPGVKSIALNTTNPNRVKENLAMAHAVVPQEFWIQMAKKDLIGFYDLKQLQ